MAALREKLLRNFEKEYAKLNHEQRQAVDRIEGPVMVVAGPGTGKTQILSVRIGKIMIETDALPSNILCLTYTDAGVLAMRKRLLGMIGPDAYSVQLHSFHSFCNSVIQQNMHLFHKRELQPLNELEETEALMQLIDGFKEDNPLKRYKTDAYYEARPLKDLFSAMKREGYQPGFLLEKIEEYITDFIPNEFANKNKLKKGIIELTQKGKEEIQKMQKLKAAVTAFPSYQQILKEKQRYDFDDMISWVNDAFEKNPGLLAGYQEQYQFILVDEYQDTSGSQNRLVEHLISYWECPNIFVVGDDDQSIFRFQGANMDNMMMLAKKYEKDLLRVVLKQNYRSVQPILDAAHRLISNNQQRLCNQYKDLEKVLTTSRADLRELNIEPVIRSVPTEFEENILVAEEIKQLCDQGIMPGRIAVIYKEHRTGDELQKFLQLQEIPVYVKRTINLLKEPFIKKIISFLQYVAAETHIPFSGEHHLFGILHFSFYRLSPLKIAMICNEITANKRSKTAASTLREYLSGLTASGSQLLFSKDAETDELVRINKFLEKLIAESHNLPLLRWMELLLNETGILSWVMQQPDKSWHMRMLNCFFDHVQDLGRRNPDITLKDFIHQLDLLNANKISIPLVQTSGNEDGVNLLTCHGSKGLEYEYVFFMGCHSSIWEGKRKPSQGFRLPKNVFKSQSEEEAQEELRRLFFVAATRAEKFLYISFPTNSNDGKSLEASRFISEITEESNLQTEVTVVDEELKLKYSALRYGIIRQPLLEQGEKNFIESLLSHFKMNVTALNNFLECPVKFYYTSLVRVPSATSESAQFGSSMHDALNHFYTRMMEDKKYPSKELLLARFQWHITSNRQVFTPENLTRFRDYGVQCLSLFFDTHFAGAAGNDFIRTEVPLEAVVNGIPLKGFADKMQYWGNDMVITDFKTGSLEKSNKRLEFHPAGSPQKPEGGNYWRQAVFYKILSDHQKGKPKNLLNIEFQFLEPNADKQFEKRNVLVDAEGEAVVQQQIAESWERIQAHDFYKGCGKTDCHWCNFVKDHQLYKELLEAEVESVEEMEG